MTITRRRRRTRYSDRLLMSHRSEATLGAGLAGARSRRRRANQNSPALEAEASPDGEAESAVRSPTPENPSHHRLTLQACPLNLGETTMQQTRARQILQSLIQGIDPVTGEELPRETVLQHADVLRALLAGLSALEQTAARALRRAQLPDNVGRAWTSEEESRLVAAFKKGESAVALAHEHGRTLRAIEARLEKLGLITVEQRTTRGGFTGLS